MPTRSHHLFARLTFARIVAALVLEYAAVTTPQAFAQSTPPPGVSATPAALATPAPLQTPMPLPSGVTEASSPSPATGRRLAALHVSAERVAFYSNRFIVGAEGAVDVTLGDGTQIRGNTFAMDLRLNRFVVAGDVSVRRVGDVPIAGAAFAEYLDFDRAYFVPLAPEPDRWTFAAGDYAHPLLGREMPGDVFYLPDLTGERVFLTAKNATIDPHESVRFTPATLNFGLASVPFPSYFLTFSRNPNFSQNSLADAYVDGPLDFAGGEHGLATLHLRYDSQDKIFPAIEAHQVSNNSYLVFSVNPLTRPIKQYNFLASSRISPGFGAQLFYQEITFQHNFSRPLSASAFATLQLTASLPHSYLQLSTLNYYNSLLDRPREFVDSGTFGRVYYYGDASHPWTGDHPTQEQLAWVGYRHELPHLPLAFQLRSSIGLARNTTTPVATFGGATYTNLTTTGLGLNVTTKPIVIAPDGGHRGRELYLTATFDKQRQFSSLPHVVDSQSETFALTKIYDPRRLSVFASYTIGNTGDFYGAQQSLAYPASTAVSPFSGEAFPGYRAFRGFATTHSLSEQIVYTPSNIVTFKIALRENRDFPRAIPGPLQTIGTGVAFFNYGVAPYQADLDVRYRINNLLTVDVGRSYLFNFGGYERWSPRFSFALQK